MDKEEIKDYLKRIDELGTKLTGEDKETYDLLIYGCNQCAKLLNETEQQCKKQKEVIDKAIEYIENEMPYLQETDKEYEDVNGNTYFTYKEYDGKELLDILNEVSE